jgi:predicted acyl esterase
MKIRGARYRFLPVLSPSAAPAETTVPPLTPAIPTTFEAAASGAGCTKRVEMIPMRDGVKLHTVIELPVVGERPTVAP